MWSSVSGSHWLNEGTFIYVYLVIAVCIALALPFACGQVAESNYLYDITQFISKTVRAQNEDMQSAYAAASKNVTAAAAYTQIKRKKYYDTIASHGHKPAAV